MRFCELCDAYLDGDLVPKEASVFENHLNECERCREQVADWQSFEKGVQHWAETKRAAPVSMMDAEALIRAATHRQLKPARNRRPLVWGGLVTTAAAAAIAALLAVWQSPPEKSRFESTPVVQTAIVAGLESEPVVLEVGAQMEAPPQNHLKAKIGEDTVAVSSKGRVRLINLDKRRVRLGLESGTVACQVDKRNGRGDFVVEAGRFAVRVVGTRFQVTRHASDLSVLVQEGTVQVDSLDGRRWTLHANDVLNHKKGEEPSVVRAARNDLAQMDALFEMPKAAPAVVTDESVELEEQIQDVAPDAEHEIEIPEELTDTDGDAKIAHRNRKERAPIADLPKWRKWVVSGQTHEAINEMQAYLKHQSTDYRIWALMGDASRKMKDWDGAQNAYEKSIRLGGDEASRSRYMLGAMLQSLGRHEEALKMLKQYKKSDRVSSRLVELTDVKIAQSLVALGRCKEAKESVSKLLESSGSIVAKNAKKMVERCGNKE